MMKRSAIAGRWSPDTLLPLPQGLFLGWQGGCIRESGQAKMFVLFSFWRKPKKISDNGCAALQQDYDIRRKRNLGSGCRA
jgi:hypothetical protein